LIDTITRVGCARANGTVAIVAIAPSGRESGGRDACRHRLDAAIAIAVAVDKVDRGDTAIGPPDIALEARVGGR
jgi:hypothetical protein